MIAGIPITPELLDSLKTKLNVGNLRSLQLNCVPGRTLSKMDVCDLKVVKERLPNEFLDLLLNHSRKLTFPISFSSINLNLEEDPVDKQKALGVISKRLNHLAIQNREDLQEYGYESFGFGFPVVVFSPQEAPDKIIRAPLFIWRLSIEKDFAKSNSWTLSRSLDQEIQYNDLLRSYLHELCDLSIQGFEDDELEDGVLSIEEIIQNTAHFIQKFTTKLSKEELDAHL